ncbi:hypothetical protein HYU11_00850 [Candidatus Woesearchaeota archaeon]|nr:hypothetical protein [Candidatus Woesearchaeota archaeon]
MKTKKSQITLFIITGILVLIASGILLYILKEAKARKEPIHGDASPVATYTSECLKGFLERGVRQSGAQAGYLFKSEGGSTIDPEQKNIGKTHLIYNNKPLHYLIKRAAPKPEYPWKLFPLTPPASQSFKYSIGASSLQTKRQLERQLEFFIENKMGAECSFSDNVKGYDVNFSSPKATVTITNTEVAVRLKFPMEIADTASGALFKLRGFQTSTRSSLGKMHETARYIIDQDNQDFLFNLSNNLEMNGFAISIEKDVFQHDDVIIIQEPETGMKFSFARQNRMPAIKYASTCPSDINRIIAYDPDEDDLDKQLSANRITVTDSQFTDSQECTT